VDRARAQAVAGVLLAALGIRAPARACEPIGPIPFTVTPSSTDQVPPTLPPIPAPMIHRPDGSSQEGCGSTCKDSGSVAIAAMATDDVTARPGYRFTLVAGTLPPGYVLPTFPLVANGDFVSLYGAASDGDAAFDYTFAGRGDRRRRQRERAADRAGRR
jgi:hypothetical protein